MIPPGHVHSLVPYRVFDRPDGYREIWSRCGCGGPTQPELTFEQRIIIDPETGAGLGLHFRLGLVWFDPADLLRYTGHVRICETCQSVAPGEGLPPCSTCGGLGVTDADGDRIEAPPLPARV